MDHLPLRSLRTSRLHRDAFSLPGNPPPPSLTLKSGQTTSNVHQPHPSRAPAATPLSPSRPPSTRTARYPSRPTQPSPRPPTNRTLRPLPNTSPPPYPSAITHSQTSRQPPTTQKS